MEYIVFDLEFNQSVKKKENRTNKEKLCPFEIIQLGAVKLNSDLKLIDTFDSFVKPSLYHEIHPYVSKITGIKISDISDAPSFDKVFKEFVKFISDSDSILCIWGKSDIKEIYRNASLHKLSCEKIPKSYIDVQMYASKLINGSSNQSVGLEKAVNHFGLSDSVSYHNALNDAYYTAKVFSHIYNSSMSPQLYVYSGISSDDIYGLDPYDEDSFSEACSLFVKTLNRELTKDEKNIISMAQYIKYDIDEHEIKQRIKSRKNRKKKQKPNFHK